MAKNTVNAIKGKQGFQRTGRKDAPTVSPNLTDINGFGIDVPDKKIDELLALFNKHHTDSQPTPTPTPKEERAYSKKQQARKRFYQRSLNNALQHLSPNNPDYARIQTALTIDREDAIVSSTRGMKHTTYEFKPEYITKYDARTLGIVGEQGSLRYGVTAKDNRITVARD